MLAPAARFGAAGKGWSQLSLLEFDESNECVELAGESRHHQGGDSLSNNNGAWLRIEDDQFDLVVADGSLWSLLRICLM